MPKRFVPDPAKLRIRLSLNGTLMQDALADDLLFDIPSLIAYASSVAVLLPGDVLITGSPAGNGSHWGRYLRDGDVMEAEISGLGIQRSTVRGPAGSCLPGMWIARTRSPRPAGPPRDPASKPLRSAGVRPAGPDPAGLGAELERAIDHAVEHLSLYQLTIEPGTWFERLHGAGKLTVPDDDGPRALFDLTQEICGRTDCRPTRSNHARPGAESRHNLVYWRYGEYAGIGPAPMAVSSPAMPPRHRDRKAPETWLERVEREGHGIIDEEVLTSEAEGDGSCLWACA